MAEYVSSKVHFFVYHVLNSIGAGSPAAFTAEFRVRHEAKNTQSIGNANQHYALLCELLPLRPGRWRLLRR